MPGILDLVLLNECVYDHCHLAPPHAWQPVFAFHHAPEYCKIAGYNGAIFINHQAKEIVVASVGSTFDFSNLSQIYYDMNAWLEIYQGKILTQYSLECYKLMLSEILALKAEPRFTEYDIICTGHSYGAVNSDLLAVGLRKYGIEARSITFENPGSKPMVEKLAEELELDFNEMPRSFIAYNARESIFNEINEHVGEMHRLNTIHISSDTFLSFAAWGLHEAAVILGVSVIFIHLMQAIVQGLGFYYGKILAGNNTIIELTMKILPLIDFGLSAVGHYAEDSSQQITKWDLDYHSHAIKSIEKALRESTDPASRSNDSGLLSLYPKSGASTNQNDELATLESSVLSQPNDI